jgi:O-Antigen ligase
MPNRSTARANTLESRAPDSQDRLIDLAAVLVMIPALLPLVVVFTPSLYFESDPRSLGAQAGEAISVGPTGSAWLAVISVAVAALALAVTVRARGRVRWWSFGLVAAGVVPCLVQMPGHFVNRLHGGAWIAAAALGLAAAHLAQFQRAKRLIVTAMIAMALPLFIQGAWYVYVEHPATVESFMNSQRDSLAARGLVYGSAEHAKYLTRLKGNDVIGAVGMSNVLGSILAVVSVLALTALVAAWRRKAGWVRLVVMAGVLALSGWALVLTQSKGAALALFAAVGLGMCVWLLMRMKPGARRIIPGLCVVFVLAGSAAVLVRGAAGPPKGPEGELSLLFRFHYWQGAARVLLDDPTAVVIGVGPGHFKDRYEAVRNPISPEVIASTHNVFVDYAVMLGIGGCAWGVLLLIWLWRAGVAMGADPHGLFATGRAPPQEPSGTAPVKLFGPLAAAVFGTQYYVQFPGLYAETAILWLLGTLGFVALSAFVIYPVLSKSQAWSGFGIALAAALLLLHAQIEMTFFWDAAAAFVWVVVGTASAGRPEESQGQPEPRLFVRYLPAVCLLLLAAALTFGFAEPTTRHQAHLANAARLLRISGPPAALDELDTAATIIGNDPTTTRWRVRLNQEVAAALTVNGRPDDARAYLDRAQAVLDEAEQAGLTGLSAQRRRGTMAMGAYYITEDRQWLKRAQAAFSRAAELSPNGLGDHVRLADTRWELGEFDSAQAAYRRALQISDQYYLDPDVQLTKADRRRINLRLEGEDTTR